MQCVEFLWVFVSFFYFVAHANSYTINICDIEEAFQKLNKVVNIYNEELDKKVPWVELNNAIKALDPFFLNYQGNAKSHMSEIRQKNDDSHNHYEYAVAPLFNWCFAYNVSMPILIEALEESILEEEMKKYINKQLTNLLKEGVTKAQQSISEIQIAIENMTKLQNLLANMEYDMNEDFSSNGYYGRKRQDLVDRNALSLFDILFRAIIRITMGPLGVIINLMGSFTGAGIRRDIIDGVSSPSLEEQIRVIDVFMETMIEELKKAKEASKKVDAALKVEHGDIILLAANIEASRFNADNIRFSKFLPRTIAIFRELINSCETYVKSHRTPMATMRRSRHSRSIMIYEPSQAKNTLHHDENLNIARIHQSLIKNMEAYLEPTFKLTVLRKIWT